MAERLQKLLASAGIASRRSSEQLILDGVVAVNGKIVTELGYKVDRDTDRVTVNGRPIKLPSKRYYIALNKPRGVVSTVTDPHGRRTVVSMVDLQSKPLLRPVGRLDFDSEGLIFLTDDGDFLQALTHPSHEVGKTYRATVRGRPSEEALERLRGGVRLEDGMTAPAHGVRPLKWATGEEGSPGEATIEITIHEGKNRQVRRMFDAVGHPVTRLVRSAIGSVRLTGLPPGAWRHLTPAEVAALKERATAGVKPKEKTAEWQTGASRSRPTRGQSSPSSRKTPRRSRRPTS